jgi:hypothetical protein
MRRLAQAALRPGDEEDQGLGLKAVGLAPPLQPGLFVDWSVVLRACVAGCLAAGAGCATPFQPALGKKPLVVALNGPRAKGEVARLDVDTESVRLDVSTRKLDDKPLVQRFEVARTLAPAPAASLQVKLDALPVSIPSRLVQGNIWEIEIPPNVLTLLSRGRQQAEYTGRIVVETGGASLPLLLCFNASNTRTSARVRSAG